MKKKPSVLVVEDSIQNQTILGHIIEESGYNAILASSGKQAFKLLEVNESPDLIILDVMMPGEDGYSVITQLKRDDRYNFIPVMFITAKDDVADIVAGFDLGAIDYICKPFNWIELKSRIKTHIELRKNTSLMQRRLTNMLSRLDEALTTDYLTGLYNRRQMLEIINKEFDNLKNENTPFAILVINIDNFRSINNNYGYRQGDLVLIKTSKAITKAIKQKDAASRWGDDEFLVFIPGAVAKDALELSERIKSLADSPDIISDADINASFEISIGAALVCYEEDSLENVITRAEKELRQIKAIKRIN